MLCSELPICLLNRLRRVSTYSMLVDCTNLEAFVSVMAHSSDSCSMDVVMPHEDWSSSSTLDMSTEIQVEHCEFNGFDGTQQLLLEESVFQLPSPGDPVDHGCELPLHNLEQWEWEPEEELQILPEEEYQQLWDSLLEMEEQVPPQPVEVEGPREVEVEVQVEAPPTTQNFPAEDQSGQIHISGSQVGYNGDISEPTTEEWEWNAAGEELDGEQPHPGFVPPVVEALFPVVPPGKTVGITFHKKNHVWEAHLWVPGIRVRGRQKKGVQIFLGTFTDVKDAALAHDRAAIKLQAFLRGKPYPLNYPEAEQSAYMEAHSDWSKRDFIWKIRRNSTRFTKGVSDLKGVSLRRRSKRGQEPVIMYEAKLSQTAKDSVDGKKKSYMLGLYGSEEGAGRMYDLALLFLHSHLPDVEQWGCITNFRPSSYCGAEIEAMGRVLVR